MSGEITFTDLAAETGETVSNIAQLVKRGILPSGRKDGKVRLLPRVESLLIMSSHKPGEHWVRNRPRPGKRKGASPPKTADIQPPYITWDDVI